MATVFLLGDSTCANKSMDLLPETGWGMCFGVFLAFGWKLENHAVNGLSTRSALGKGVYEAMRKRCAKGDWVIIQFGHNDSKPDAERHADPWGEYQDNLRKMVEGIRAQGASAIILSSIERRRFLDGVAQRTLGAYPDAARDVAKELSVPFVPMHVLTRSLYQELGTQASCRLFNHVPRRLWPNYPQGKEDDTHLSLYGAQSIAGIIATSLRGKVPFIDPGPSVLPRTTC